jgi:hypothetical protein
MIEITIKRTTSEPYKETVNFQLTSEPTSIKKVKENTYGGGSTEEICYKTTNEPREVTKYRNVERVLLTQQIEDESKFDLAAVVKAVNKL